MTTGLIARAVERSFRPFIESGSPRLETSVIEDEGSKLNKRG